MRRCHTGETDQANNDLPATGEFKIVEVTNPREPVQIASWGVKQDLGEPVGRILSNGTVRGDDCRPVCRGEEGAWIYLHDCMGQQGRDGRLSLVLGRGPDPAGYLRSLPASPPRAR